MWNCRSARSFFFAWHSFACPLPFYLPVCLVWYFVCYVSQQCQYETYRRQVQQQDEQSFHFLTSWLVLFGQAIFYASIPVIFLNISALNSGKFLMYSNISFGILFQASCSSISFSCGKQKDHHS